MREERVRKDREKVTVRKRKSEGGGRERVSEQIESLCVRVCVLRTFLFLME